MRVRATRPNVFRDLKRFGVYSTDWKYILVPTAVMYLTPFLFGAWVYHVPLGFPLGLLTFLVLMGVFNFLRASKPKFWMKYKLGALLDRWCDFRPPLNDEFERSDWIENKR
jgi:hypothetical protein